MCSSRRPAVRRPVSGARRAQKGSTESTAVDDGGDGADPRLQPAGHADRRRRGRGRERKGEGGEGGGGGGRGQPGRRRGGGGGEGKSSLLAVVS